MPRNTKTGQVLERMALHSLELGNYTIRKQVNIGNRPTGSKHLIDVLAIKDEKIYPISLKWQQVSGTAEQKVPFEVISLIDAVKLGKPNYEYNFKIAYLVLGGEGWTLRDFYINRLHDYLPHKPYVEILTLEAFAARANSGKL